MKVKKGYRTVNVEPDWTGMFRFAVQLVRDGLPEEKGRDTVIEMLEFGKRLNEAHESEAKN